MYKGRLFVISGPSGVGKGTICKMVLDKVDAVLSVSMTTRKQRQGEVDGESYHFVSVEEFELTMQAGGFLEYAKVYGNYYGTPKKRVTEKLGEGRDVILEIDVQGAAQIKKQHPEGIFIFCLPPSIAELRDRILKRGTETEENIKLRMIETLSEILQIVNYDYCIINSDVTQAVAGMKAIIESHHYKITNDIYELTEKYKEEMNALSINK